VTLPRQTRPPQGLFAERLDHLFRVAHPKDRGPYTPAEAAEAINEGAGDKVVSGTYLWLLRTGQRDNPTMKHLIAIARFFAVPPTYFFPDDSLDENAVPAELTAALGDEKVREMALQAAGLSDRSLKAITDMINSARSVEGLPDAAAGGGTPKA
jgi:transcriptional regulator with XRE-family HTH domain